MNIPLDELGHALLFVAGSFVQALSAGAEMGVYSLNRVRLNLHAQRPGSPAGMLRRELENLPRLLATLLVSFNLFGFFASLGLTNLLEARGFSHGAIILLNVLIVGPLLFVGVDTLPKELFRACPDTLTYLCAPMLVSMRRVLQYSGVLPLVQGAAALALRLLPPAGEEAVRDPRQRIAQLLKEGARDGSISETQATLLDRAMALREVRVADEMVPWSRCLTLPVGATRAMVVDRINSAHFSRWPLIDRHGVVVGVVEHLDLCLDPGADLLRLARPPLTIPPNISVREALTRLSEHGSRLAIVVRGTRPVGIVTVKDLVEPLTGEIHAW